MEFIRMINYLIRFGLFIYRDGCFQSEDMDFIFSYLSHICDIFTTRSFITSKHSLDKIISQDTILTDATKMNPIQKAAFDIKYQLFNKNFASHELDYTQNDDDEEVQTNKKFHIKILIEIIGIFHLFNDLRQDYLVSNNVEYFYKTIYLQNKHKALKDFTDEDFKHFNDSL